MNAPYAAMLAGIGCHPPTIAHIIDGNLKRKIVPELGRILAAGGRVALECTRFAGEAAAIRACGGLLVEIRRPALDW